MGHYIHHVSGRLRVKSPLIKKHAHRVETDLQALFGATPGVRDTEFNKGASCVIIYYDPELVSVDQIIEALKEAGYLDHPAPTQALWHRPHVAAKAGDLFGKAVFNVVVNKTLERSVTSLVSALL